MALINRRNALLGWAVWQVGKQAAKRKAKASLPFAPTTRRSRAKRVIAAGLATLGGVLWFLKRRRDRLRRELIYALCAKFFSRSNFAISQRAQTF